ncbi:hypothetical protein BGZ70_004844 [Mortierella alpina]|uniref:Peptidase A1 domain-containing protein n=1 Tax=Mortierella alpina TaxID=64518 RepID=A0A9P6J9R7_MORAP|nr:hypothetical protein BGZ70_004844 [Mortierella alpina]
MKFSLAAAVVLAYASATSAATVVTVPMTGLVNTAHQNAASLTRRYLHKRGLSTALPLTSISGDVMYTVPVSLGTPGQQFNLAIDTGSPVTWVVSSQCTLNECPKITNRFNCAASTTCRDLKSPFNASYVSGDGVQGQYIAESYTLGSLQFTAAAGLVNVDTAPLPAGVDGIMGLWYYAKGGDVPFLNVLKNSTLLAQPQVGIWLQSSPDPKAKTAPGGEITFGGVDTTRFTGELTYVNCVSNRPWTIPVGGMTVNGRNINVANALGTIDTGTTAMLMPQAVADAINSAIPGSIKSANQGGLWFLPCSGTTPITITFGGLVVKIPHNTMAMQNNRARATNGAEYCLSAAMFPTGSVVAIEEWLIGDTFLKNVYSVFDFGTNAETGGRIGFALLADNNGNNGNNTTGGGKNGGGNTGDNQSSSTPSAATMTSRTLRALAVVAAVAAAAL